MEKIQELEATIASLNRFIAEEFKETAYLRDLLRWRDAKKEPPKILATNRPAAGRRVNHGDTCRSVV